MAFTKTTAGGVTKATESYTLPSSATTEYSSVFSADRDFGPRLNVANRYVTFTFNASAVSGTNLDIGLYACDSDGSNPVLLKDAVVTDITAAGLVAGQVDINAYPAQYYKLGWTTDADESANTITVEAYF